jgi:predicted dehydrogenase
VQAYSPKQVAHPPHQLQSSAHYPTLFLAYLPAIAANADSGITLKAIYSRSEKSAHDLATTAKEKLSLSDLPPIFHDGGPDLDALLARDDISAVFIILPITTQPSIVLKALAAGKHILSEKPIAPDVASAQELIATYERDYKPKGLIWRVAENFEAEPLYQQAGEILRSGRIGKVEFFNASTTVFVDPESNEWYKTPWRTVPDVRADQLYMRCLLTCIAISIKVVSL